MVNLIKATEAAEAAVAKLVKKELPHLNQADAKAVHSWIMTGGGGLHKLGVDEFVGDWTFSRRQPQDMETMVSFAGNLIKQIKGIPERLAAAVQQGHTAAQSFRQL